MAAIESLTRPGGQSYQDASQQIIEQQQKLALDNMKNNLEMAKWQSVLDLAKKMRG
jgi:hypothetical protein